MTRPLALIVDDEAGILATLGGILTDNGFVVAPTPSGAEALDITTPRNPAAAVKLVHQTRQSLPQITHLQFDAAETRQKPVADKGDLHGDGSLPEVRGPQP